MRRTLLAFVVAVPLALGIVAAPAQASPYVHVSAVTGQVVPGQYIVTLKPGSTGHGVATASGVTPQHVYTAALNGFAATLNATQLSALQHNPNVVAIEPDQVVHATTTQSPAPSWGLDRIDQRFLPLNNAYTYFQTASTITAYVIDTGIAFSHPDFGGRASKGYDVFGGTGADCNGHGTHVSGTIGGTKYGVAKLIKLKAVRVLNCSGSGTWAGVIAGIDWVRLNSPGPSVANMSLGGGFSSSVNTATTNLANSGVLVAVAAGNSAANACNFSPASASAAVTAAASDRTDHSASFTNFGSCVDLYAPGVSITSDWLSGGTNTISGTSMASPHVAGVAALYKSRFGETATSTLQAWLKNNATAGVIIGVPAGTPNRLLYTTGL
jgi:subtilisin family serine protease